MTPNAIATRFRNDVFDILSEKEHVHYPGDFCINGDCKQCAGRYNWKFLSGLLKEFLTAAPDVTDEWKRTVQIAGFDPDVVHEAAIGVFMGYDRPDWIRNMRSVSKQ